MMVENKFVELYCPSSENIFVVGLLHRAIRRNRLKNLWKVESFHKRRSSRGNSNMKHRVEFLQRFHWLLLLMYIKRRLRGGSRWDGIGKKEKRERIDE